MRIDWRTLLPQVALFAVMVLAFVVFGSRVGWRVVGVVVLVCGIQSLRQGRVGIAIEGREPFHLTGKPAVVTSVLIIVVALVLLVFPEVFESTVTAHSHNAR